MGIHEAYQIAADAYLQEGDNRIIVCTDGDLTLGTMGPLQLGDLVEKKLKKGSRFPPTSFQLGHNVICEWKL